MKLYICADMEGIAGVVSEHQVSGVDSSELHQARLQYTEEVKAVCLGSLEAGIEEIYVNDFHGNGRNLMIERLPPEAMVIRGDFRPSSGFELLDNTFVGLVLLGTHARTGTAGSILPHTYSSKLRFEIYGQPVGEFDILALVAGEERVPTILISGDSKTIEQASTNLPATHSVITKYSMSGNAALCVNPAHVCDALREEIKRAVKAAPQMEPSQITPPVQFAVKAWDITVAERISWIPGLERRDDLSFEFAGANMKQIARLVYGLAILTV